MNNWSSYRRKQVNIEKAQRNDNVNQHLDRHYWYLHNLLVKQEGDEDVFNDSYLRITYTFNPEVDFIQQFISTFNRLKGAYRRDDKVANYNLKIGLQPNWDQIPEEDQDEQTSESLQSKMESLRNEILNLCHT